MTDLSDFNIAKPGVDDKSVVPPAKPTGRSWGVVAFLVGASVSFGFTYLAHVKRVVHQPFVGGAVALPALVGIGIAVLDKLGRKWDFVPLIQKRLDRPWALWVAIGLFATSLLTLFTVTSVQVEVKAKDDPRAEFVVQVSDSKSHRWTLDASEDEPQSRILLAEPWGTSFTLIVEKPEYFGVLKTEASWIKPIKISAPDDLPPAGFRVVCLLPNFDLYQRLPGRSVDPSTSANKYSIQVLMGESKIIDQPWFGEPLYFGASIAQINYVRSSHASVHTSFDDTVQALQLEPAFRDTLVKKSWTRPGSTIATRVLPPASALSVRLLVNEKEEARFPVTTRDASEPQNVIDDVIINTR